MSQPSRPRVPGQGDWGIAVPAVLITFAVAIAGFWPVMIWHGYGGPTGNDWRWDIHSTIAEAVYFGVIGFIGFLYGTGHRSYKAVAPTGRERPCPLPGHIPPPSIAAPPACLHLDAVPVDLSTGERVAWWCEACETQLDGTFGRLMRPCCDSAPGTAHQYNCPHRKGSPS